MINPDYIFGRLGNRMFQGAYIYAQYRDGAIPDIYLQGENYFGKYKDEIKSLYRKGIEDAEPLPYVAVHVRRGDYVGNDFYVDLFEDGYYQRAMAEFPPGVQFLIFSDNIEWCKQQELFAGHSFSDKSDPIEAMNEMMLCEGHIISNSSFSWWGAFLAPYTKQVVAPAKWFNDGIKRIDLPDSWIRI